MALTFTYTLVNTCPYHHSSHIGMAALREHPDWGGAVIPLSVSSVSGSPQKCFIEEGKPGGYCNHFPPSPFGY